MNTQQDSKHPERWLVSLMLVVVLSSPGQVRTWESIGPEGGTIAAIAQDTASRNIMFAATYTYPSGIYRSADYGLHWSQQSTVPDNVMGMLFDPRGPGVLYVYSYYVVYRSTDAGISWNSASLSQSTASLYLYDLVLDPSNPSVIHGAAECWTYSADLMAYVKSTDGGATWSYKTLPVDYGWATAIDVEAANPQVVYLGGYATAGGISGGRIFKSTNGGGNFTEKTSSLGYIADIVADPTVSGKLYVATGGLCTKSTDGGNSWTSCDQSTSGFVRMAIDGSNPSRILGATTNSVYLSTDGGASWASKSNGIAGSGCTGLVFQKGSSNTFFFASSVGIFRTADGGVSWSGCNCGIIGGSITALAVPKAAGPTLFAGMLNNTVYKASRVAPSTSWEALEKFYVCSRINTIVIVPTDTNVVFAGEGGG